MPASITVGDTRIVSVLDMVPPPRAATDFFPAVPEESWQPYEDALTDGMLQLYYGSFFVATRGTIVLVDTGMGPGPHPTRGNRTGDLLHQLRAKGVAPGDVSAVVHTHLHADHVGWNVDLSGDTPIPNFPNARYYAPSLDWEHFTHPDVLDTAPQVKENVIPLHELGLLELIDGEHAITEEITTLPAPGHTPGHQVIAVTSGGETALITGDMLHAKEQIENADWCAGVDTDKTASAASREAVLARAEREGLLVAAGHFHPGVNYGRVVRRQGRRYWQAL